MDFALVKNIFAVRLAVLLISKDLSSSAEVIKIKSSIANETLVQLFTFKIMYLTCLLKTYLNTNLSPFLPRISFSHKALNCSLEREDVLKEETELITDISSLSSIKHRLLKHLLMLWLHVQRTVP